jgi:hypothetical protein
MSQANDISETYRLSLKTFREYLAQSITCGRLMINIREQLGQKVFKAWLEKNCPEIPWNDAELLMDKALDTPLAQKLDAAMEQEES